MAKSGLTRDEQYLVKLFEIAPSGEEVNRYQIGKAISQNDKSVDNIVRMLAQTNFIEKGEGQNILITPNGIALAKELLS